MNGWDYHIDEVPEGDARKLVTLEKDGMVWIGIRAFHHETKTWLNNGADLGERVVAWRDLPEPANPRGFAGKSQSAPIPSRADADDLELAKPVLRDKPSTSYLQRRLGWTYNHASAVIETLEAQGFISKPDSAGRRQLIG